MIISEQKYTNKNRLYYRGLADDDKNSKFYKETYLTTRLIYALAYSFGLSGIVEVYRLKDTANIFNMRSKTDEGNLRRFCQEHKMSKYLKYFETLKNNDWLHVLGEDRQKLINAIKSMGYDGYFNSEIDESRYEELKNSSFCNFSALQIKSPSVAIFNLGKSCDMIAVYNSKEDFEKSSEIKEIKQQEQDYIIRSAAYFTKKTEEDFFDTFPMTISGLILVLYGLAFLGKLSLIDWLSLGVIITIVLYSFTYGKKNGRDKIDNLIKELFFQ